ncbi:MAG: tetratricopeptide repeat protein [Spirochaetes bacterium]|nr:tetratricopeptide repeat protein [Spirochaetota bacterium]
MEAILRVMTFIIFFMVGIGVLVMLQRFRIPARIRKAEELFNENEIQQASEIVKWVLEKQRDYVPARYLRARIFIAQKQYVLAINELNSILQIPDFPRYVNEVDIHYALADLYNQTQQWQREVDEYEKILQFNPDDLRANYRVGHAYYRQNKYEEAKRHLAKALEGDPTLTDCLLPLGVSSFYLSQYEDAENYLLKSIDNNPNLLEAHYYLALIYKAKKDYDAALRMFENAKRDNKFYEKSLLGMGEIYYENAMYEKAIELLEQGVGKLRSDDEIALKYRYILAESFEMLNKINEAVYHWEQIAKKNPEYRGVRMKLEEYYRIMNNENMKMLFLQSLEELQPLIAEIISGLNYNIISKQIVSRDEYYYKAFNVKRINEPPIIIYFHRTTREITENQVLEFYKIINKEKCRSGIYISTSKFSLKAKSAASTRMIELLDASYLYKALDRIRTKFQKK